MTDIINGLDVGDAPGDYAQPYAGIDRDTLISGTVGLQGDALDAYAFVAPTSGLAMFRLAGLSGDLDLYLYDDSRNYVAVAASENAGIADEGFQYALVGGRTYFIATTPYYVDGWSNYTLTIDFAEPAVIEGTAGNDTLNGGAGADRLRGRAGDDALNGGGGEDHALFGGNSGEYRFGVTQGQLTVRDLVTGNGNDGIDRLSSIEVLDFANRAFTVAQTGAGLRLVATAADDRLDVAGGGTLAVDGRGGRDIAVFRGKSTDYAFSLADAVVTVRDMRSGDGDDGTRKLTSFETLRFQDRDLAVTGGEFRVNTETVGDQLLPSIAALAGGGYVVGWASTAPDGKSYAVYAQRFSADGVRLGREIAVSVFEAGWAQAIQGPPSVAGLAGGGFVIGWPVVAVTTDQSGISRAYARVFDAAGAATSDVLVLNEPTFGDEDSVALAPQAGGGFVAAWSTSEDDDLSFEIHAGRYDASGTLLGTEIQVNTSDAGTQFCSAVTVLKNGGYVIAWVSLDAGNVPTTWFQRFDAQGNRLGANVKLDLASDSLNAIPSPIAFDAQDSASRLFWSTSIAPKVEALQDGGFVICAPVIDAGQFEMTSELFRFNGDGTARGAATRVGSNASNTAMSVLGSGVIVVTWSDLAADGSLDMYSRRFSATGVALGPQFLVNTTTANNQGIGAAEALPAGGYVIVWTSSGQDLSDNGVYGQQYQADGNVVRVAVRGTDGDDVLFYIGDDAMRAYGFKGDDVYIVQRVKDLAIEAAGEGTDTIKAGLSWTLGANLENLVLTGTAGSKGTGNALSNTITGNTGANTLNGGKGADTMAGGSGNDVYYVDSVNDVVVEEASAPAGLIGPAGADPDPAGAGSNIDKVIAQVSYTLRANVENLTLAGTANLTGTGNGLDNLLIGNSGANALLGKDGTDVLDGAAGNDSLDGGPGRDTVGGGGGADTLVGGPGSDKLIGGAGADVFRFDTALGANIDTITDFVPGIDRIQLDNDVFTALADPGALGAAQFASGAGMTSAVTAAARIVHNTSTGALYYDADGVGGASAIGFAVLGNHAALTATDFVVVA